MANSLYQWMITGIIALLHPFYVSVIEIQHKATEKNVDISVRIFTEDLEGTLKKINNKVDLIHPNDQSLNNQLINSYITKKLQIKIDGKVYPLHYVGYEQQQESIWAYFDMSNITSFKKIDIDCSILYDFETNQINIFHIKEKGIEKSYKLDYPKTGVSFDF